MFGFLVGAILLALVIGLGVGFAMESDASGPSGTTAPSSDSN